MPGGVASSLYNLVGRMLPQRTVDTPPQRIVFIRPCCIGDVVMATAALAALRRLYPAAHITWAVGGWSQQVAAYHPDCDAVLDTGNVANPAAGVVGLWQFAQMLRQGDFDMAISLVRSPWMSLAVALSGIPQRVGLDSGGRGFGYTLRVPVDPLVERHEAQIYLDVIAALGGDISGCYANLPVQAADQQTIASHTIPTPYVILNPNGGNNPGMQMDAKRWPLANFAALGAALAEAGAHLVLLGGPDDRARLNQLQQMLPVEAQMFAGDLPFGEIAALAQASVGYVGNDTGLTHLAAAVGARTVMIMGPSNPARYAPFVDDALVLWRSVDLAVGGVAAPSPVDWDWVQDGIAAEDAIPQILTYFELYVT